MPVPCQSHVSCKKLEGQLIAILIIAKYSALLWALVLPDLSDVIISSHHNILSEMFSVSVALYSASSPTSSCTCSCSFTGSFFLTFLKLMFFRDQLASHFILQMHPVLLHLLHWLQLTSIYTNNSMSGAPAYSPVRPPGTCMKVLSHISTYMSHRHFNPASPKWNLISLSFPPKTWSLFL